MPDWLVIGIAVATPLLALGGTLLGQYLTRKSSVELDRWRKREETMRMLRWATDLALSGSDAKTNAALGIFEALSAAELLDDADRSLVAEIAAAVARAQGAPTSPPEVAPADEA